MADAPLDSRTDAEITDDVTACLLIVAPQWVRAFDPTTVPSWVRVQLDDLEANARQHGIGATGCMVVEYDAAEGKTTWSVIVATRWDVQR